MKELIGKTIKKIFIADKYQNIIIFETTEGKIIYRTSSECCSETYISEILGISQSLNEKVIEIEELYLGTCEKRTKQDVDEIYAYKIKFKDHSFNTEDNAIPCSTNLLIIFRNSSNGYYGGSIRLIDEDDKKHLKDYKFIELTENYYAD